MNLMYICTVPGFQVANDIRVFDEMGHATCVVNTFHESWRNIETYESFTKVLNLYSYQPEASLMAKANAALFPYARVLLAKSSKARRLLKKTVTEESIDVVICAWDSGTLIEAHETRKLLREMKSSVPVIFRFLMYPSAISEPFVSLENLLPRRSIENLDGRIWPTQEMMTYVSRFCEKDSAGIDTVIPFVPSRHYYPKKRLPKLSNKSKEPQVIFIGSSDFRRWERDVSKAILRLCNSGVHVHMAHIIPKARQDELSQKTNRIHFFSWIDMINLTEYMTQFDAALVLYEISPNMRVARFRNNLPNRLFWCIASGISIIVVARDSTMRATEELVKDNSLGITVREPESVADVLMNKDSLADLSMSAMSGSAKAKYERYLPRLSDFLCRVREAKMKEN